MKPNYPHIAVACSFALASFGASAQTTQTDPAQPASPATQQAQPAAPGTQPVPPNAQQGQPIHPDTQQAMPGTDATATQTSDLVQEDESFLEDAIQGSYAEIEGSQLALEKTED